jgi:hypothetical protein
MLGAAPTVTEPASAEQYDCSVMTVSSQMRETTPSRSQCSPAHAFCSSVPALPQHLMTPEEGTLPQTQRHPAASPSEFSGSGAPAADAEDGGVGTAPEYDWTDGGVRGVDTPTPLRAEVDDSEDPAEGNRDGVIAFADRGAIARLGDQLEGRLPMVRPEAAGLLHGREGRQGGAGLIAIVLLRRRAAAAVSLIHTCPQPYSAEDARWIWNEVVTRPRGKHFAPDDRTSTGRVSGGRAGGWAPDPR